MGADIKIENKIIFYDGYCIVCSRFINFLIKVDKRKQNRFASISSKFSQSILKDKLGSKDIGKFIVYLSNDKIYSKSDAVLQIFIELGGLYKFFSILKIFPSNFRNSFYEFFAINRYKWFGKFDECHLPPKEIADRFYL